jgi:hypothetical protein
LRRGFRAAGDTDTGRWDGGRVGSGWLSPSGKRRLGLTPASILVGGNVEHTNDNGLTLEVWDQVRSENVRLTLYSSSTESLSEDEACY